jgi:hypothetical protein
MATISAYIEAQELISLTIGLYFDVHSKFVPIPLSDKHFRLDVDAGKLSRNVACALVQHIRMQHDHWIRP